MTINPNNYLVSCGLGLAAVPQEYKQVRSGSVYWTGVSSQTEAEWLAGKTIATAPPKTRMLLLADSRLDEMLAYNSMDSSEPIEIRSYQVRGHSPDDMLVLTKQLDRAAQPKARLIILVMPITKPKDWLLNAESILTKWRNWVEKNQCVMVVVGYGAEVASLTQRLTPYSKFLAGLAFLQKNAQLEMEYLVWHWRNELGVFGQALFQLNGQAEHLLATDLPQTAQSLAATHPTVFLQNSIANPLALVGREHYEWVASWAALVEKGLSEPNSALVFALEHHQDLEELARTLYYLRQQRQQSVRLVVVETGAQALRRSEVELLTLSGCSLVIPKVDLARFFNLLEILHAQPDYFQLTHDLDQALQAVQAQAIRGELAIPDFVAYLENVYGLSDAQEQHGSLVLLTPVDSLSTWQLLAQIQMQREGDVVCATAKCVYVFLFECEPALVNVALERLLRLPPAEVVIKHQILFLASDVQQALEKLRRESDETIAMPTTTLPMTRLHQVFQPVLKPIRNT
ncbi:BcsE family c-di-GMP-binding protein [Paenalcaligenes hominis]|uniref:BcsE family c-di-GMP-binding protein n=1 Tax=Paenalcaligenes hominis TaxID=643674 RepID=UPI0035267875